MHRKPQKCPVCGGRVVDIIFGTVDMREWEYLMEYRRDGIMGGDNIPRRPPIWACAAGCKRFRKVNTDGRCKKMELKKSRGDMMQDEKWIVRYEEVVCFIKANHRNPSKHRVEEHLMLNWVKQQRKLLNAGRLKEDRVGRFKELLALIEENKRVN